MYLSCKLTVGWLVSFAVHGLLCLVSGGTELQTVLEYLLVCLTMN